MPNLLPGLQRAALLVMDYGHPTSRSEARTAYNAIVQAIRVELCDVCHHGSVVDDKGRSVQCEHPGLDTDWQLLSEPEEPAGGQPS